MLKIINGNNAEEWNALVKGFRNWDVYYLFEYANSLSVHGDGEPLLICYEDDKCRICYAVMRRDIGSSSQFAGLDTDSLSDLETPYGYGGPLAEGEIDAKSRVAFECELNKYCKSEGIVSQFVRFHPLLGNHAVLPETIETRALHETIYVDLASLETIDANMDSKNRNMVRKAQKSGVTIECCSINDYRDFMEIYIETMDRDAAADYYYFQEDYFEALRTLHDNACIFYAILDGERIGGSIILYNDRYIHYHLSGTRTEYRGVASGNLLLYEIARWGSVRGIRQFHLGGGLGSDDGLFRFKKRFNKNGFLPYVIGRTIFDREKYDLLRSIRSKSDPEFDPDNGFMIQYRG